MRDIENIIGKAALLEQLAEESAELAKAALKQARIIRKENPTPITMETSQFNLREEFSDVIQCARELGLIPNEDQIHRKDIRWHNRVNEKTE